MGVWGKWGYGLGGGMGGGWGYGLGGGMGGGDMGGGCPCNFKAEDKKFIGFSYVLIFL